MPAKCCVNKLNNLIARIDRRLLVMAGVVAILMAYWAYQWLGTATLEITSEPTGAVVTVDGRQRGIAPTGSLTVDAGQQAVLVKHSHYEPVLLNLSLRRGDHEHRHVVLPIGSGTLELLSNPRDAWVEVDGERLAEKTPTRLQVASGPHEIRMGLAERHIVAETHTVRHDETLTVNFDLNIDPHGSLTITTEPRGAQIEFLDADEQYNPQMRLRIGEYPLRVSKAGYLPQEFRYQVRYGDNLHHVKLKRGFGQLKVSVQPADSELTVQYTLDGKVVRKPYTGAMQVPVGAVEVRARALGHRTVHRNLRVGVEGASVRLALEPFSAQAGHRFSDPLRSGGRAPMMVVVPAGEFVMGDDAGSYSEKPARRVTLTQPFAVSATEVTIGDYLRYAEATGSAVSDKLDRTDPEVAMAYVTYEDAYNYAAWLSEESGHKYRLPTEPEWEYVARAGSQAAYAFGDDAGLLCQYGNIADLAVKSVFRDWDVVRCDDGMVRVGPVGQFAANAFGLHDLYGNVAEWVTECGMPGYRNAPTDGRPTDEGVGCSSYGYRGGSWDSSAAEVRSAYRNSASTASDDRGIRLVREL